MVRQKINFVVLVIIISLTLLPMSSSLACQTQAATASKTNNKDHTLGTRMQHTSNGNAFNRDAAIVSTLQNKNITADNIHSGHMNSDSPCDYKCCSCAHSVTALSPLSSSANSFIPPNYFYSTSLFKEPDLTLHHPPPIFLSL